MTVCRLRHRLILDNHEGAAAHPAADRWDDVDDIDYLYREYAILVREQDAERVVDALGQITRTRSGLRGRAGGRADAIRSGSGSAGVSSA